MEINFRRYTDDDALIKQVIAGTEDGKIIIDEFILRIPIIEYNAMHNILLLNELTKCSQEKKYTLNFKSWQCIEHRNITGNTLHIDFTSRYRSHNLPMFAGFEFKTNKSNTHDHDPTEFYYCNVKNFGFEINGKRYPEELQDVDFKNNKYCKLMTM